LPVAERNNQNPPRRPLLHLPQPRHPLPRLLRLRRLPLRPLQPTQQRTPPRSNGVCSTKKPARKAGFFIFCQSTGKPKS
jgi:hypothetical protein